MPKPLRSESGPPKDIQFAHFGVLNSGSQSKGSLLTAVIANVLLALIAIILGAAVHKVIKPKETVSLVVPVAEKPPEPPKPPPPPPKIIPPKPPPIPPEPPKIKLPEVKVIEPPKPVAVKLPKPMPVITPAPPRAVVAAAAPKPTTVNLGHSASVVNNDPHPAPVSLGNPTNPLKSNLSGPAVSPVNMGSRGMAGMPPGSGGGPHATAVNMGSGQPNGSLNGGGARQVEGVKLGVKGGQLGQHGNGIGVQAVQVATMPTPQPVGPPTAHIERAPVRQGPQVLYKPRPVYTADATAAHVEGNVQVKIHVAANGAVTVLGVTSGLGHGLDQSAVQCARGIRFKPAVDVNGNPIDWDGTVSISFQLAG